MTFIRLHDGGKPVFIRAATIDVIKSGFTPGKTGVLLTTRETVLVDESAKHIMELIEADQ